MVHILSRGTSGDSVLLRKKLPPGILLVDGLLRSNLFPLQHLVQRRGAILNALFKIYEGFYFGSYHLIMAFLLHFEEKVHRKKLQRADTIPLLFSRLLCHILEHIGYPTEPHLECLHHCREQFTLEKWTQLAGCSTPLRAPPRPAPPVPPQAEQAQQDERPTESVPPTPVVPIPKATYTALTTFVVPLVPPSTSKASITISIVEFCAMVQTFQTLTTTHTTLFRQMADIRAQQDQHTAILHQLQQHLGLLPLPQPDIPGPLERIAPVEETTPAEETTRVDALIQPTHEATTGPSSPHDPTTTWSYLYIVFTYYISRHNYMFWCFILWDWMYFMIISHIVP